MTNENKRSDESPLSNDFGTYLAVGETNEVLGSLGLGEDELPSTIINLLREELQRKLEMIPGVLQRLDGCTVQVIDQSEFHSDMHVVDPEGMVLLTLQHN